MLLDNLIMDKQCTKSEEMMEIIGLMRPIGLFW